MGVCADLSPQQIGSLSVDDSRAAKEDLDFKP